MSKELRLAEYLALRRAANHPLSAVPHRARCAHCALPSLFIRRVRQLMSGIGTSIYMTVGMDRRYVYDYGPRVPSFITHKLITTLTRSFPRSHGNRGAPPPSINVRLLPMLLINITSSCSTRRKHICSTATTVVTMRRDGDDIGSVSLLHLVAHGRLSESPFYNFVATFPFHAPAIVDVIHDVWWSSVICLPMDSD
ncbi:hypothetical protein B0H19DRAFT_1386235 [Mycena capillaripes]|nr:hypothetical protein B0H19DRAFT_1386235 [Mycena capillaripes]